MARPTSRAAVSLAAPTTWISTSFEAPSPSATMASASVRATCSTASSNAFHTAPRSEEHTSELQSSYDLVCRLLLEKKKQLDTTNDSSPASAGLAITRDHRARA